MGDGFGPISAKKAAKDFVQRWQTLIPRLP
jgi:hypothetical protein